MSQLCLGVETGWLAGKMVFFITLSRMALEPEVSYTTHTESYIPENIATGV